MCGVEWREMITIRRAKLTRSHQFRRFLRLRRSTPVLGLPDIVKNVQSNFNQAKHALKTLKTVQVGNYNLLVNVADAIGARIQHNSMKRVSVQQSVVER